MRWLILALALCLAISTANAFEIVKQCGDGYIARLDNGKMLMHVEGTPYEIGYQQGCLAPEAVHRMTKEFVKSVLRGYDIPDELIPGLIDLGKSIAKKNEKYVPSEFIEEMKGVADGARDQGYDVSYEDVLLLNMGFDVVLSVAYPIATPIVAWQDKKGVACDGFVAMDDATSDGRVLMGRSFMFNPEIFHEVAMLIEYYPEKGHRFVSVSAPGFVGVTAAMSSAGIAIGMDMVPAMNTKPFVSGMGCLLTARQVVQYADELSDAVNMVKASKRGVPWLYIVGDGKGREKGGAVLEVSADKFAVRYMDYEYPDWAKLLNLPRQIEDKDDLVVLANHYIVPEMYLTLSYAVKDSLWRYETLTNLLLQNYGNIDVEKGKEIIDYLHPPNYGYYGEDENRPVPASRTLFDLSNLELWSLYGMYSDPWAHWKLEAEQAKRGLDKAWKDTEGDTEGGWKPINYGSPIIDRESMLDAEDMQKLLSIDGKYVEQCVKAYAGNPNYATIHLRFNTPSLSSARVSITFDDQNDGVEIYAWNYELGDWKKVYGRVSPSGFTTAEITLGGDYIRDGKLDLVLISEAKWRFGMIYDKACVAVDSAFIY